MSLYNDIRPTTLDQVVGQDNIKSQLKGIIASGNIPNAFLLNGPRGTGKTTVARIIARNLNCTSDGESPCGECKSCQAILNGASYDVIEMDAASNNKVEDVRGIIEKAQYAPLANYKIFILDEVHMFSSGAWNALLKLIEEPPARVVFILCTTEEHKVPATIISRCRRFYFQKIDLNVISDYLADVCDSYGKAYEEDALKLIAQASEGCMRDALSIMESFFDNDNLITDVVADTLGMSNEEAIFGILNAVSSSDPTTAINIVREQGARGKNAQLLVKALISAVTDTMFILSGTPATDIVNTSKYRQLIEEYAPKTNVTRCLELSKSLGEAYSMLSKAPDALFLIESSLIRAINTTAKPDISISELKNLEDRIAKLEKNATRVGTLDVMASNSAERDERPNIVDFPDVVESLVSETGMDVAIEESSPMDLCAGAPFPEDEIIIPNNSNNVNACEDPLANETLVNQEASTSERVESPIFEDDLLSHLPAGTQVVCNDTNADIQTNTDLLDPNSAICNDKLFLVGKEEPAISTDENLSAAGFDGFADWL